MDESKYDELEDNELIVYKSGGERHDHLITLKLYLNDGITKTNLRRKNIAVRQHAKYRTNRAYVVSIIKKDTNENVLQIRSGYRSEFIYLVEEFIEEKNYNDYDEAVCSRGIHFYLDKEQAYFYEYKLQNGIWKSWHDNGNICEESNIVNGLLHGIYKKYNDYGKFEEKNYQNGQLEGCEKHFYDDGNIWGETYYVNDKRNGIAKIYHRSGHIEQEITYENNSINGSYKKWDEKQILRKEYSYKDSMKHGICKEFSGENGEFVSETEYSNGKLDGYCKEWYDWDSNENKLNDRLKRYRERQFKNGALVELIKEQIYKTRN